MKLAFSVLLLLNLFPTLIPLQSVKATADVVKADLKEKTAQTSGPALPVAT
jgi:hypothetical protein